MPAARGALYIATIGALALLVRSFVLGPIPLWIAAIALTAYVTLIMCGVIFLRLQMFVDVVWRGPESARGVALTFDDGPHPLHTPKILDLLDEHDAKATFFVIGKKAERYPELVKKIEARGHLVAMHGYGHDRLFSLRSPDVVRKDLVKALEVLDEILGVPPLLFRPPIGHSSPRIAKVVDELGLTVVGWSIRALDGTARAKPKRVVARVVRDLKDGAIVMMHDAAERDDRVPASLEALPKILEAMKRKDLAGVRVDEWITDTEKRPTRSSPGSSRRSKRASPAA